MSISFPDEVVDSWNGGTRHKFEVAGHEAWIVEPPEPLPGGRWFWLPEWPTAFSERTGTVRLIELGFYFVHVNVFGLYANDEALGVADRLYEVMRRAGLAETGSLTGMSLGGLYSFRFAAAHPERFNCIYADAPVCAFCTGVPRADNIKKAYHFASDEEMEAYPGQPVNNLAPIAAAGIPVLMLLGEDDLVVPVAEHGNVLEKRFRELGGDIKVIRRPSWGHHPHGLDDPAPIVSFVVRNQLA